jgi:hypothetical protein
MKNITLFSMTFLFLSTLFAQNDSLEHEISGNVSELSYFHEVIYKIWHEAYPEKNYEALKGFTKEINEGAGKIYSVKLPGILRDKKPKWDKGLLELKVSVESYNSAVANNNNETLLEAAENLHSKYEMLVRIIRPVLKEVNEFHRVLYITYHKDLPEKKIGNIKLKTDEFVIKAKAITQAKLPQRMEKKTDSFNKAAIDLLEAAINLKNICNQETQLTEIKKAVDKLHTKYQALELVFD